MRLAILHRTTIDFPAGTERVALRLRLYPPAFAGQAVTAWRVGVNGSEVPKLIDDAFGNGIGLWHAPGPLDAVEVVAEGTVETEDRAGVVRELRARPPEGVFLRETALTATSEAARALAGQIGETAPLPRLHALAKAVEAAVAPGAAEGAAAPAGRASDLAHLLIAAARVLEVPARFVTGYLLGVGAAATAGPHAWAEAFVPGLGWVGFDAMNGLCPTDRYVRLACGFDARDTQPVVASASAPPEGAPATEVRVEGADQ
jgi:transglutaminase-like putative cysteine protease